VITVVKNIYQKKFQKNSFFKAKEIVRSGVEVDIRDYQKVA